MSSDNLYVYGVVGTEDEPLTLEVETVGDGSEVYTISQGRLAAVVSDVDETDPERTDENATRHDEVLREVMDHDGGVTVVPMAFGMVFAGTRPLKHVLRAGSSAFRKGLREVDGAVELGVQVVTEDEDAAVDPETVERTISGRLDAHSRERVDGDRFSDRIVVNHSYLVDRDDRTAFDDAVDDLEAEVDDVLVRYTGPWAPYNFVDIEIGAKG